MISETAFIRLRVWFEHISAHKFMGLYDTHAKEHGIWAQYRELGKGWFKVLLYGPITRVRSIKVKPKAAFMAQGIRNIMLGYDFAIYQFFPECTSANMGTGRETACSISSFSTAEAFSCSSKGHSTMSSS